MKQNQTASSPRTAREVQIIELYSRWIRYTHWLNVPLLFIMIWSGLLIYWANAIYLPLPDSVANALGLDHKLAEGLGWHFAIMWLFTLNGLIYGSYLLISGEWRDIVPLKRSFRDALGVVAHDLHLRKEAPVIVGKINGAQRFAYTGALALGAAIVLTGIAIYKPVQTSFLTELLGGYATARFLHFACMVGFVLFILVHVAQVIKAGFSNFLGMASGWEGLNGSRIRRCPRDQI